MKIRFWGVRGVCSIPGRETTQFGGHTAAIEVTGSTGGVLLDAGTGSVAWGAQRAPMHTDIVLTRVLLEHIGGIPFVQPLNTAGQSATIWSAQPDVRAVLEARVASAFHPFGSLGNFATALQVGALAESIVIGDLQVAFLTATLDGFATTAVRIASADGEFVYTPAPLRDARWAAWATGADVLIHGATTSKRHLLGYGSVADAIEAASSAGIARLVLTHFGPDMLDAEIGRLADEFASRPPRLANGTPIQITPAREGATVTLRRTKPNAGT